jgi:hypothetical protein
MTLSEAANWAQILSIPLAVLLWLFTRESADRFWKRYAWSVLCVVVALTLWGLYRFGWLDWLGTRVDWPIWALILLALSVPIIVCVIAGALFLSMTKKGTIGASFEPEDIYRSDLIEGIEWQWGYHGHQIDTSTLTAFCPDQNCMCRLEVLMDSFEGTVFRCPHCSFQRVFPAGQRRRIAFEIERRIRTRQFMKSRLD